MENLEITEDVLKATGTGGKERQLETSIKTKCCSKKETESQLPTSAVNMYTVIITFMLFISTFRTNQ